MKPPHVVVVGDSALDVIARQQGPIVHGDDVRANLNITPGGAAANTAAWLTHQGAAVTLVSRVGDDVAGAQIREELTAAGVRCAFTIDDTAATGCVVVLVDEHGQRTMLSDRGANARLQPSDLDLSVLETAAHLHLSGYVLLDASSRPAGLAALAAARAAGLSTSLDPQVASMIEPGFLDLIHGVDLLLPNAEEYAVLGPLPDVVGAVAVTDGAGDARWVDRAGEVTVAAEPVECVDSTGAGDAFDAGLLVAWLGGADPATALRAGVRAGALAVSRVGARPPHHRSATKAAPPVF